MFLPRGKLLGLACPALKADSRYRMFRMFRLDVSISLMRKSSRTQDRPPKNKKTQIAALSLSYNISSIIFVSGGEFDQLPSPAGCRSQG